MNMPTVEASLSANLDHLLQDRLRFLNTILDNLQGMVYCNLYDEHWTMIFVSEGSKSLTGYNPDMLIHNKVISYEQVIVEEYRQMVRETIAKAVKLRTSFEVEYCIRHKDGRTVWVAERGSPIYNELGEALALEGHVQDISARKNVEQSLRDAERRFRSIFENAIEGIYQTTAGGQYLVVNPALAYMYGYSSAQELMSALNNIQKQLYVDPHRREEFVKELLEQKNLKNFQSQVYRRDGSIIWISENAHMVHDESGNFLYYEGTVEDITEHKNYEKKIEHLATHDSLTGLPNRHMLSDRLQQCINYAVRGQHKVAVAFLDLDQFKLINDSLGHEVGDQLLIIIAERLTKCLRQSDTVVRLGGDEFVMLLPNVHEIEDSTVSMQRVLNAVAQPCIINNLNFVVSCSIGISIFPDDASNPNILLKHADAAMYEAKHAGRNNYQIYTQKVNDESSNRVNIEYRLRGALERGEFVLHYQPKLDFKSGTICGAEALIRWAAPGEELISPSNFIQIAEETGLIEKIGEWVLVTACLKAKEMQQKLGVPFPISVNVSPRQFKQPNLAEMIKKVLDVTQLNPECLELEITESTLINDAPKFIETLHLLKKLGVKLAIDDFGTGYSSLAYLKNFPVDRLKIDKLFVKNSEHDAANAAILKAIIVVGQSLKLKVIAEGVETADQYEYLESMNCDELQGYYFSKPLAAANFEDFVYSYKR